MDIRDPIHGAIEINLGESKVIDSEAFQRLRNIKQLGFSELTFPGATHSRYLHSLGVLHLSGIAFEHIFKSFPFANKKNKKNFKQVLRLAALLHDIGHGPLSHSSEEVMPPLKDLNLIIYANPKRTKSNHEDYTIKFITDSPLATIIEKNFPDFTPIHVASLVDPKIEIQDDFFIESGLDFRPILSQIVSSELDVDRMDYLNRDSLFCGTSYGHIDTDWLLSNLTYYQYKNQLNLAISRRAIYAFDDFLISRHHMYLMIYFHHKSIMYDEMLHRYLKSKDCDYRIPADINEYLQYTDHHFYQHIAKSQNPWAKRITEKKPFVRIFELHETTKTDTTKKMQELLESENIEVIRASSQARLSKYHQTLSSESTDRMIFVVDPQGFQKPYALEDSTDIFEKYERARVIERLYVRPDQKLAAENLLKSF